MKIEFVAHASVVYRRGSINLICDPWLMGTAFDDSWALLSEPVFKPEDFADISHIWLSHEHPDHFSPRSLASIPENIRPEIVVLFHSSADKKIPEFCHGLGFGEIIELTDGEWLKLGEDFEILCETWDEGDDSWLLVRTPEGTILNLNDCQLNDETQARSLRDRVGPVDTLLTQFSISAWEGNPEEVSRREAGAQSMLDRAVMHAEIFEARHVIPFASFIWCCHVENAYMNAAMVRVGDVAAALSAQTAAAPIVMYPGDIWTMGANHDSPSAIARYDADIASLPERRPHKSAAIPLDRLREIAARFSARLRENISPLRLYVQAVKMNAMHQLRIHATDPWRGRVRAIIEIVCFRVRPARIWLTDHGRCVTFDLLSGLRRANLQHHECDLELSSAALAYAFKFLWGGETLQVNGRFREIRPHGRVPLFDFLWIASAKNHEEGAKARPL